MGDPVGAARHVRRGARRRRHLDGRRADGRRHGQDNLNPVGRAYYGFSTLLCTPASLAQDVGLALGTQAGPARIRDVVTTGGLHPVRLGRRRRRSTGSSRSGPDAEERRSRLNRWDRQPQAPAGSRTAPGTVDAATASRSARRSTATGAPPSCSCRPGRSSTRGSGRPRSVTWRGTSGWSPSTAGGTAGPTGRRARRRTPTRSTPPTPSPCWTPPAPTRAVLVGAVRGASRGRCTWPPTTPTGCRGCSASAPSCNVAVPRDRARRRRLGRARRRAPRAGRSTTATTGSTAATADFLRVLLRPDVQRAALHQADRGLPSAGRCETTPAGRRRRHRRACTGCDGIARDADRGASARAVRCPVLLVHGTDDRIARRGQPAARRAHRRVAGAARGRGHGPLARDPVRVNHLIRDFVDRVRARRHRAATQPDVGAADAAPAACSYLSSPIGLGHARRDLAIADELRKLHPTSRSTGWPSTPSPRVLERAGERVHPASALAGQRVGPHRARGRRARPARLPGDPADGRGPRPQLHGLRRRGPRRAATTWSSATRPGTSTTSCTRTPSSSGSPFAWMTDFVGWLPMPDGGAARGAR